MVKVIFIIIIVEGEINDVSNEFVPSDNLLGPCLGMLLLEYANDKFFIPTYESSHNYVLFPHMTTTY